MISKQSSLSIVHSKDSILTDYSHKMSVYGRDEVTLSISSADDFLYIGFYKQINSVYIDITSESLGEGSSVLEYWNGNAWTQVINQSDDTLGLHRSGFIRWDKELNKESKNTINNTNQHWYRLTLSTDRDDLSVTGMNLVFSDDYELSLEQPYILDSSFLGNSKSHIKTHAAVKREIIQRFRNKNYVKYDSSTGKKEDITIWDLHEIEEVKLASTYLALSKIYFHLSDEPDDIWAIKSKTYEDKFNKYINVARLSVDIDDNGSLTENESKTPVMSTRYIGR